jgi:hypothetical protein
LPDSLRIAVEKNAKGEWRENKGWIGQKKIKKDLWQAESTERMRKEGRG